MDYSVYANVTGYVGDTKLNKIGNVSPSGAVMHIASNSAKEADDCLHESPEKLGQRIQREESFVFSGGWESFTDGMALEKDLKNEYS